MTTADGDAIWQLPPADVLPSSIRAGFGSPDEGGTILTSGGLTAFNSGKPVDMAGHLKVIHDWVKEVVALAEPVRPIGVTEDGTPVFWSDLVDDNIHPKDVIV